MSDATPQNLQIAEETGRQRMVALLDSMAVKEGIQPTRLDEVSVVRTSEPSPRVPLLYEPMIIIVGQGRKRGYFGSEVFQYDPHNYFVLSVPMPLECETYASREEPLLAVKLNVQPALIGELLLEMDDGLPPGRATAGPLPSALCSTPLDASMTDAVVRLLTCLQSPTEARVLGRAIVREIFYRILCGDRGDALRALAGRHGHFGRIARSLRRIHTQYAAALPIEELAREASMSLSAFHAHFKAVTRQSPLQYQKAVRLHKARLLMTQDGLPASTAAMEVGYESPSQFSREFKRFFGDTPSAEAVRLRG